MKRFTLRSGIALTIFAMMLFTNCSEEQLSTKNDSNGAFDSSLANSSGIAGDYNAFYDGEGYNSYEENPFISTEEEPISTFSIDADGASYSNARRFLEDNVFPPKDAIRTEEIINFFQYDYPEPEDGHPISVHGEISHCPWTPANKLLRIGIKGKHIPRSEMPPANFVFLIDVSGSMASSGKLDLLKVGFNLYAEALRPEDKVAIVTYAGEAGVLLPSTPGTQVSIIQDAISQLGAGGSTNGAGGIIEAYNIAFENFIPNGNNRVILGTDGDFNVGLSSQDELVALIEEKRELGIFLSVLGVGTGNLQDGMMEQLANNGNGNYEYIDDFEQAEKVFLEEFGKFYTVAKDVKIQVEFNPSLIQEYRLIGYENRLLENEDFEDDEKDAGEIGADQRITALYELVAIPTSSFLIPSVTVDFRYKMPDSDSSIPLVTEVFDPGNSFSQSSENQRFAATAAGYGLMLRNSEYKGNLTWDDLLEWVSDAQSFDPNGYRAEFLQWIQKAKGLE